MLPKIMSVAIVALGLANSAFALLPPWYAYQRLLAATVGANACVTVGALQPPSGDGRAYTAPIQACSKEVAAALKAVLKPNESNVDVKVYEPGGLEAESAATLSPEALKQQFQLALAQNRYFARISDRQAMRSLFFVELKPLVVQVWSDNIADAYGNSNYTAQDAFSRVLNTELGGGRRVGLTTSKATQVPAEH